MARDRALPVVSWWNADEKAALIDRAQRMTRGNISEYLRRAALGKPMRVQTNHLAIEALRNAALAIRKTHPHLAAKLVEEMERLGGEADES